MNKKTSYAFRILAGTYLVYIGYSLIKKTLADGQASVGFLVSGVLFAALGLCCCATGLLASYRSDRKSREEEQEKSLEEQTIEENKEKEQ